jgi:hypothetical protein
MHHFAMASDSQSSLRNYIRCIAYKLVYELVLVGPYLRFVVNDYGRPEDFNTGQPYLRLSPGICRYGRALGTILLSSYMLSVDT